MEGEGNVFFLFVILSETKLNLVKTFELWLLELWYIYNTSKYNLVIRPFYDNQHLLSSYHDLWCFLSFFLSFYTVTLTMLIKYLMNREARGLIFHISLSYDSISNGIDILFLVTLPSFEICCNGRGDLCITNNLVFNYNFIFIDKEMSVYCYHILKWVFFSYSLH